MRWAYYNDNDPYVVEWLRKLISRRLIPDGEVDARSIVDVAWRDVYAFAQCHFFAGIGGWPRALSLTGNTGLPCWTGSCPCQPFSAIGKRQEHKDTRDLWPEFRRLIAQCKPPKIFGEQVGGKLGRDWLTGVRIDLERLGYAVGAADLCAASAGAPHIRQRLFWVADTIGARLERHRGHGDDRKEPGRITSQSNRSASAQGANGFWTDAARFKCLDHRTRRIKSGVFPLAHGVPARVGRLRGYGNAIVPQVAAAFIKAAISTGKPTNLT